MEITMWHVLTLAGGLNFILLFMVIGIVGNTYYNTKQSRAIIEDLYNTLKRIENTSQCYTNETDVIKSIHNEIKMALERNFSK